MKFESVNKMKSKMKKSLFVTLIICVLFAMSALSVQAAGKTGWVRKGTTYKYKVNNRNPELLGYHIKAFINLEVAPKDKKEFYPYIENWPNVIECNCVTGDYSMLLEVQFKSTDELDQFIGELQVYGRTKTLIVFSTSVEHREVAVQ